MKPKNLKTGEPFRFKEDCPYRALMGDVICVSDGPQYFVVPGLAPRFNRFPYLTTDRVKRVERRAA